MKTDRTWRGQIWLVLGAAAVLAAAGCKTVDSKTDCNDGADNDGDGLFDGEDPGCAESGGQNEWMDPVPPVCSNGEDDDGDGQTDFPADPGCADASDDSEVDPPPPPPECGDGLDNNGNGKIDYPWDSGCDSPEDEDEDDDPPITDCSNGADDDADGLTDYPADIGCSSAADLSEYNAIVGECGPGIDVQPFPAEGYAQGERTGPGANELNGLCGGLGAEFVWTFEVTYPSSLLVQTNHPETTLDTVVYVRSVCRNPDTELGCDDDDPPARSSTLVIPRIEVGNYYVIVDSFNPGSLGEFKVTVEQRIAQGEPCDPAEVEPCAPGLICRLLTPDAAGPTCEFHECGDTLDNDGDGTIDYPFEAGCVDLEDDTELIPGGDPIPACGNLVDDDGDDLIDYPADPGCRSASDTVEIDECSPGIEVLPLPDAGIDGNTSGGSSSYSSTCDWETSSGPERVHAYQLERDLAVLRFHTTSTAFPSALYVRTGDCETGAEVACVAWDWGDPNDQTVAVASPVVDTTYFVFVDAGDYSMAGAYHLSVDGEIAAGAPCVVGDTQFVCTSGYACRDSGFCETSQCNDGVDNDGDGRTDYPAEPGCDTPSDDDEVDPTPMPICSDGLDNDSDGFVDYPADMGCRFAADPIEIDECSPGVEVLPVPDTGLDGTTVGGSVLYSGSCDWDTTSGAERVHAFRLERNLTQLRFRTTSASFANTLYVRTGDCAAGTEVACDPWEYWGTPYDRTVTVAAPVNGETYYVFVDSGDWMTTGTYHLSVEGEIAAGQPCAMGDAQFVCTSGYVCRASGVCEPAQCNDMLDNDTDLLTDYPAEPGCATPSDDDETDPTPLPVCSDGVDNDGDGVTDYPADVGCRYAADPNEINECVPGLDVHDLPDTGYSGTVSATSLLSGSCYYSGDYGEAAHVYNVSRSLTELSFTVTSWGFDAVMWIRRGDCATGTEVACQYMGYGGTLTVPAPALGDYFVIVDSAWGTGSYTLAVAGRIALGEACDPASTSFTCADGATCGASLTCEPTACNDGIDNDGDLVADEYDPGCTSILDNDETNPAVLPECADGIDNDADTLIDFPGDPGCTRAADSHELDCEETDPLVDVTHQQTTTGVTTTAVDDWTPTTCAYSAAGEIVHVFDVPGNLDSLDIDLYGSSYDTVLYVKWGGCDEPEIGCNDDSSGLASAVWLGSQPAGTFYIFVDGYSSSTGSYTMHITGTVSAGAPCDPLQVVPGFLSCASGTCTDDGTGTHRCI